MGNVPGFRYWVSLLGFVTGNRGISHSPKFLTLPGF